MSFLQTAEKRTYRRLKRTKLHAAFNKIQDNIGDWPEVDQGNCLSCWAFSLSQVLTYHAHRRGRSIGGFASARDDMISPQYFIDCINRRVNINGQNYPGCNGCDGCSTTMPEVFAAAELALVRSMPPRRNYRYLNHGGVNNINNANCVNYVDNLAHFDYQPPAVTRIGNAFGVYYNSLGALGPFYAALRVGNSRQYAQHTIFAFQGYMNHSSCHIGETGIGNNTNHIVVVAGYGVMDRSPTGIHRVGVWWVGNSWNEDHYLGFLAEEHDGAIPNTCLIRSYAWAFR